MRLSSLWRRPPDFVISKAGRETEPYLKRWWVIPRNPYFNIYLHHILRSDDDRALHDHPWWNLSIVLKGGYAEVVPATDASRQLAARLGGTAPLTTFFTRRAGAIVFRQAEAAHRLEIRPELARSAWTLFITGPRMREWGFHCPKGWVFWRRFVDDAAAGAIGPGCGE